MTEARAELADGREKRLDPRSIQASRIAGGIWAAVLGAAGLIVVASIWFQSGLRAPVLLAGLLPWFVATATLASLAIVWPRWRYRHTSYRLDSSGIRIRRGVVWRAETSIPRSRVQHTDVSRGPIERGFGLATLVIHTAGTEHAAVSLSGLSADAAYPIRDYLLQAGEDDDAV